MEDDVRLLVGGTSARVSYRGGGVEFPPQNIEIEYGYYISYLHVTERKHVSQNVVWKVCP